MLTLALSYHEIIFCLVAKVATATSPYSRAHIPAHSPTFNISHAQSRTCRHSNGSHGRSLQSTFPSLPASWPFLNQLEPPNARPIDLSASPLRSRCSPRIVPSCLLYRRQVSANYSLHSFSIFFSGISAKTTEYLAPQIKIEHPSSG